MKRKSLLAVKHGFNLWLSLFFLTLSLLVPGTITELSIQAVAAILC